MQTRDGEFEKKTAGEMNRHFQDVPERAPNTSGASGAEDTDGAEGESEVDHRDLVRRHLKVLLLHLAARSKEPGRDLEDLLHEVIDELHTEVKNTLEARSKLRLVSASHD
jgi:hypothetical protein